MNHSTDKSPQKQQREGKRRANQLGHSAKTAANPRANYERYIALARESVQVGDAVQTENWYQHADHYLRMMRDPTS